MSILRRASTVAAISVAGAGIAVGGVGLASADDDSTGQDSSTQTNTARSAAPGEGRGHGHGPGTRGGSGDLAAGLAEALGVQEADVTAALGAVRDQLRPEAPADGETRTPPTQADREARQADLAAALADELGVSEQEVTDALASMVADRMAEGRSALAERLDAAIADGSLTEADKQSVLKAFDAGVLGGGQRGPGGDRGADDGATGTDS